MKCKECGKKMVLRDKKMTWVVLSELNDFWPRYWWCGGCDIYVEAECQLIAVNTEDEYKTQWERLNK